MKNSTEKLVVLKFGGTSVSSFSNWENIVSVVQRHRKQGYNVCLVHSALSGVSSSLQQIVQRAPDENVEDQIKAIKQQHISLADDLGVNAKKLIQEEFNDLNHLVKGIALIGETNFRLQARVMALGELMATKIGAAYLSEQLNDVSWLDARDYIKTHPQKNMSNRSQVLSAVSKSEADQEVSEAIGQAGPVVVTQGFIGSDVEGKTVLLGRGGSDVSAAYFAAKAGAQRLEIWTDVPGMFSANPSVVPSARLLKHLSYAEAQEIATNGANILHPRTIMPTRKHQIPIHIRCTSQPEREGTIISADAVDDEALVKAVSVRDGVILISMSSLGMWQEVGFLADAFAVFKRYGLSIDLVSTSQSNVTVSLDPGLNDHFMDVRAQFVTELEEYCSVEVIEPVSAVSLLGRHIRTILHQLGPSLEVFQEHQVYLLSQAANDLNFTFVVEAEQADQLVRQLHEQVILQTGNKQSFGASWTQIMGDEKESTPGKQPWWKKERSQLLDILEDNSSSYVYHLPTAKKYAERIQSLDAVSQPLYAIKANDNPKLLSQFRELGFGFECVSIGEVQKVLDLFPDINPQKILFTPNFAPRAEYKKGLSLGVNVTLDSMYSLQEWPELFEDQQLFLRIDPGHGHGHHKHVKTGGVHSKFGIPRFEVPELAEAVERLNISVKGLHAHIGSGIKDSSMWKQTALILHEVSNKLGGVEVLDLGGGFGISEHSSQPSLSIGEVNNTLNEFNEVHPEYDLWVEPGRYLVAAAGVLLTKVTQLKGKGEVKYVGVETGMNSFIRPALYGARHTIVNLSRLDEPSNQSVNVVGPICESGDKLGIDRMLPESEEGDIILVANAGAYGKVMSSNYNLREPAGEIVVS